MELKEMITVMQAALEGKVIEFRHNDQLSNGWKPCPQPSWNWLHFEYRVKPETKIRPYANAQEFLTAMKEHGPYIYGAGTYDIAHQAHDRGVTIGMTDFSYSELVEFTWQDGTPCGIEEGGEL